MAAATFAAIASFEMVIFGKAFVTFGRIVKIDSFDGDIFVTLVVHSYKFINFRGMFLIVSKYLIPSGFRGMTLFPFVILRDGNDKGNAVLMNHEKIHLRQQIELLVVFFYVWYLLDYGVKLLRYRDRKKAYRNIVFEREAYENEKDLEYLNSRPFWKFRKYV
jgi:hypothetical protein